jgi:DMSO reductase anchor subunit
MEIVKLKRQNIWGIPAVINFTLGSTGAGFYLITVLHFYMLHDSPGLNSMTVNSIIALLLIVLGFFALWFEAGNPVKNYYTLFNLKKSWMSREVLFALVFAGAVAADLALQHTVPKIAASVAAVMFIVSQAFIVYKSRAIISWNVPPVAVLFIFSGFLSGYGLYMLVMTPRYIVPEIHFLAMLFLSLYLAIWLHFLLLYRKDDKDFASAIAHLRSFRSLVSTLVVGGVVPLILLILSTYAGEGGTVNILYSTAGACLVYGMFIRNGDIITKAGYFRKLEMKLNMEYKKAQ